MATYRALALQLRADSKQPADLHYVYFRQHVPKNSENDSMDVGTPHALFVVNVPQLFEEHDLAELFSVFGPVHSALLLLSESSQQQQPPPPLQQAAGHPPSAARFRAGRVYFEQPESLQAALHAQTMQMVQPPVPALAPAGLQKWIANYQRSLQDEAKLTDAVNRFMMAFDDRQKLLDEARRRGPVVDDEGFTLVVSKRRKQKLQALPDDDDLADPGLGQAHGLLPQQQQKRKFRDALGDGKARKRKKPLQHSVDDLYKFQKKAEKLVELNRLRKSFDSDRKKLSQLRKGRKFGLPEE